MRERLVQTAAAVILVAAAGSACAMTAGDTSRGCKVIGGEKLPADSGGSDVLCQAIAAAVDELAPGVGYQIEITVLPMSRLSAKITTAEGGTLPEQGFAQMDKPLSKSAFQRFARAIAAELTKAGGKNS